MAKQKQKGAAAKHVQAAAELTKKKKTALIRLIAAAVGGVVIWALYTFVIHDMMPNQMLDSAMVFIMALCLVFLIGEIGNSFAKTNADLRKIVNMYGVTKEQIDTYIKNH